MEEGDCPWLLKPLIGHPHAVPLSPSLKVGMGRSYAKFPPHRAIQSFHAFKHFADMPSEVQVLQIMLKSHCSCLQSYPSVWWVTPSLRLAAGSPHGTSVNDHKGAKMYTCDGGEPMMRTD